MSKSPSVHSPAILQGAAKLSNDHSIRRTRKQIFRRQRAECVLTRRKPQLIFEQLLGDLSAAFVRVSVDQIDDEIERWLERVVLAIGVDRSLVVQLDARSRLLYITHEWAREGMTGSFRGLRLDGPPETPWLNDKVRSGELVVFSRLDDLPPEASIDRETFRQAGTKSNVTVPLRVGEWW